MRVLLLDFLDSSSVISVHDSYYGYDRVPEFWEWLYFQSRKDVCKIPPSVYLEIRPENKKFDKWIKSNKENLVLRKKESLELVRKVTSEAYGENLTEMDIKKVGADPFLIASALEYPECRIVVTHEVSQPSKEGANRKVPDICDQLDVKWMSTIDFIKKLNFKTKWESETPKSELDLYFEPQDPPLF